MKMNKILMLASANIRKTKSQTISLGLMFIIAAMLFNIGLLVFIEYGGYFKKLTEELNTSDMCITIPFSLYNDDVDNYIRNHENVTEADRMELLATTFSVTIEDEIRENVLVVYNADEKYTLSNWKFVGEYESLTANSIYLTNYYHIGYGFNVGDDVKLNFNGIEKTFKVKGFTENILKSSTEMGMLSAYISGYDYEQITEKAQDLRVWDYYLKLKDNNTTTETDIINYIKQNVNPEAASGFDLTNSITSVNTSLVELARTLMASIVSAMLIVFAIIIVVICLIVVRFRINNSISEDIINIGSLRAIGYSSFQIVSSIAVQFSLISVISSIAGIALSYTLVPVVSDVLASQSALTWEQGFNTFISGFSLLIMILFTALISYISAIKIKKLNPIIALRGGITTHSFKKNYLPLEKTKGRLSTIFAGKYIMHSMKQSIMIMVITITVGFGASFAFVMFYNTMIDTKTFGETPGLELSNISIEINPHETDSTKFADEIFNRDDVWKVLYYDTVVVGINDVQFFTYICEDFTKKETQMIYEGRYPIHDNEIALGGIAAELIGVSTGDIVVIDGYEYIVSGLQQGSNYGGKNASMTLEGYQRLKPDYSIPELQIYLTKGSDTALVLNEIVSDYEDIILDSWNMDKELEVGMGTYINIVSKVGISVLVIMLLIIILVLYFIINSSVIRRKRELGIQKAIGFTTFELMNQMSLSFLPAISIGIIIGSVLGIFSTNPIMSGAQRGMGIMKANYIITPGYILLLGLLIVVISYIASLLITAKIRKISAYALITE